MFFKVVIRESLSVSINFDYTTNQLDITFPICHSLHHHKALCVQIEVGGEAFLPCFVSRLGSCVPAWHHQVML